MRLLLTGGHSGIGLEVTRLLLREGHAVGLVVRDASRQELLREALGQSVAFDVFCADLAVRPQVEAVATEINSRWGKIDGLFNNAGVLLEEARYTDQGNEMHCEVNAVAPYLLTKALLPCLEKSENPFVISTATAALHKPQELDIDELKKPTRFVKLFGSYVQSKLALVLLMNHLAEQTRTRIASVDPGANKTSMTRGKAMPFWLKPIRHLLFQSPAQGAQKLYSAAFAEEYKGQTGVYISGNKMRLIRAAKLSNEAVESILATTH